MRIVKHAKFIALIAAAGLSSRMGMPKALRLINNEAAAFFLARMCKAAHIDSVFISLPDFFLEANNLVRDLELIGVNIIKNIFPHNGYAGSIESALLQIDETFQGIVIMPIDGLVSKELITLIINIAQSYYNKPLIIIPHYYYKPGHPVYLSKELFLELKQVNKYGGLKHLVEAHAHMAVKLCYPDPKVLLNINEIKNVEALKLRS